MKTNLTIIEFLEINRIERKHFIKCFWTRWANIYKTIFYENKDKKRLYLNTINNLLILCMFYKITITREDLNEMNKNK